VSQLSAVATIEPAAGQQVSLGEALRVWTRIAMLSFGGPAGQIAVMHRILVEEKRWISEERFLHALNYCMLLPGPEAQQLATYVGWLMHRTLGGIMAGVITSITAPRPAIMSAPSWRSSTGRMWTGCSSKPAQSRQCDAKREKDKGNLPRLKLLGCWRRR
jgi:chromate transporter